VHEVLMPIARRHADLDVGGSRGMFGDMKIKEPR
jgi:hypothetical protein